jgi:hypothetical protein
MLKALTELAVELEEQGEMLPPGFSSYREPIRWTVHVEPGPQEDVYIGVCRATEDIGAVSSRGGGCFSD